jgi:hypothetical protein
MGGSNTSRVMKMLVTNSLVANTGTNVATAVDNDVILLDRAGAQLANTATVQNNKNADVIRVLLGKGTASATAPNVEFSTPIQVKNIRKVTTQVFQAAVQHVVVVNGAVAIPTVTVGQDYSIKITHHDLHQVFSHKSDEFYTTKAITGDTATTILNRIATKITANTKSRVTATMGGANLTLTGKAIAAGPNASVLNNYMFSYFHVGLKSGFDAYATGATTVTAGRQGNGLGVQVRDLERLSTQSYYRDYTSFPNDDQVFGSPIRATSSGQYNIVVIEHGSERSGDLTQSFTSPSTTIVAFATSGGAESAKQSAFMMKLTSIVESAGVYVSDVTPV